MPRLRDYVDCSPGNAPEPAGNGQPEIDLTDDSPISDPGLLPSDPPGTRRGWAGLRCPLCNASDEDITFEIALHDVAMVTCGNCGEEFSPVDAVAHFREVADKWLGVVQMTRLAPVIEKQT